MGMYVDHDVARKNEVHFNANYLLNQKLDLLLSFLSSGEHPKSTTTNH